MITWVVVVGAGLGTYALRASLILAFGRQSVPAIVERTARFVAPAAMAAIAAGAIAAPDGTLALPNLRMPAAVVAVWVAWRTESLPWTVVTGLAAFYLLDLAV